MIQREEIQNLRQEEFQYRFEGNPQELLKRWTLKVDGFIIAILKDQLRRYHLTEKVDVIALGGYGRKELHPYSDVDLLILYGETLDKETIGQVVQPLWDTGLKLGLVIRHLQECKTILGQELATDISFLDRRLLMGSGRHYKILEQRILRPWLKKEAQKSSQELIDIIKLRVGETRDTLYRVEPHLKDGIGALRDLHRVRWILKLQGSTLEDIDPSRYPDFLLALNFLIKLRTSLHMICGRRLDILEIMLQPDVSRDMGYDSETPDHLMQDYFKHAEVVCYWCRIVIEKFDTISPWMQGLKHALGGMTLNLGVNLVGGWLMIGKSTPLEPSATWIMNLFLQSAEYQVDIGMALRNLIQKTACNLKTSELLQTKIAEDFLELINLRTKISSTLLIMHETGFLEKIIPEFKALRCKVQYTSYHEYTVDQHTLLCVGAVDDLLNEDSPDGMCCRALTKLWLLRMGLLLHDIGKGIEGDHVVTGTIMSKTIGRRFGLQEEDVQTLRFLVYQHLTLSKLAFRREPEDNLIEEQAKHFRTREHLDLLYLLTRLDAQHVGTHTWTAWKSMLLSEIYRRISLKIKGISVTYLDPLPHRIILLEDALPEQELIWQAMKDRLMVSGEPQFNVFSYVDVDEFIMVLKDKLSLCADMMACITSEGYDLLHAVLKPIGEGVALQVWYATTNGETILSPSQRLSHIRQKWTAIENHQLTPQSIIMEHQNRYPSKTIRDDHIVHENKILWSNDDSEDFTVLEIHTRSRPGLVYNLARDFHRLGLSISGARISTRIENAEDVFYLQKNGQKFDGAGDRELNEALYLTLQGEVL